MTRCAMMHVVIFWPREYKKDIAHRLMSPRSESVDDSMCDELPDLAVGLGRLVDAGIGHTARPLPIAVADSPIEAASPDPQQPMCFLE